MKVVSDRLNCSASACILAASSDCARSKTHSGLPLSTVRPWVKTLTMRYAYAGMTVRILAPPGVGS